MASKSIEEITRELATGYPSQEPEKTRQEFTRVLEIVLLTLARKVETARQQGKESIEEIWKAIRSGAEEDFQSALAHVERLKVLYVASKFMNNRADRILSVPTVILCTADDQVLWRKSGSIKREEAEAALQP